MLALMYYGGGGGGYGYTDYGMDGAQSKSGIADAIKTLLDGLPTPLATLIVTVVVLLAAWLVGLLLARVFGNIFYPDPEKPSIFSKTQKLLFLGGFCFAFGLVVFSLTYTPKQLGEAIDVNNMDPAGLNGETGMEGMEGEWTQPLLDENGDPLLDENGEFIYPEVPPQTEEPVQPPNASGNVTIKPDIKTSPGVGGGNGGFTVQVR